MLQKGSPAFIRKAKCRGNRGHSFALFRHVSDLYRFMPFSHDGMNISIRAVRVLMFIGTPLSHIYAVRGSNRKHSWCGG